MNTCSSEMLHLCGYRHLGLHRTLIRVNTANSKTSVSHEPFHTRCVCMQSGFNLFWSLLEGTPGNYVYVNKYSFL